MGTIKVKDPSTISANYKASASRAGTSYKQGIVGVDWKTPAASAAAEQLYGAKVQEAVAAGRRQKAIQAVSNDSWYNMANVKGSVNIVTGITNGADKQAAGYAPYGQKLNGMTIPDRVADGHQNLIARAGAVVDAEIALKKQLKG